MAIWKPEITYRIIKINSQIYHCYKLYDGDLEDFYVLDGESCNCASFRQGGKVCKHLKMKYKFFELGMEPTIFWMDKHRGLQSIKEENEDA